MSDFCGICYGYTPNGYHRTQWLCNVVSFPLDAAFERGLTPEVPNPEGVVAVETADDLPRDAELVVLSPETARIVKPTQSLLDFEHPKRAIYFFGNDTRFLSEDELGSRVPDHIVSVPHQTTSEADEIYSFAIGAIVLYDRMLKRWQSQTVAP